MRLLLIEDNQRLAEHTKSALGSKGFTVDTVATASDAEAAVAATAYDCLILDLGLPDIDGLELLATLRRRNVSTPILVVTARDKVEDLVEGLNRGADDYLRKPFEVEELAARIRALLRRPGQVLSLQLSEGNVHFDTNTREVRVSGTLLDLGRREIDALELLMRRAGRVVSKTAIEEAIYGFGEELGSNAIEVLVHRLRKRMTDAGANIYIHTLRGAGYLLSDKPG